MKYHSNLPLKTISHYKIGGPTKFFVEANSLSEVKQALTYAKKNKLKTFIVGGATNLLISDQGFDGLVLRPNIQLLKSSKNSIQVGAGNAVSELLEFAAKSKLSGLEWAGGLPGTVGGAIRGNAGCFGGEMKDSIVSVTSLNVKTLKTITRTNKECRFGYRHSIFKAMDGKEIIISAKLKLAPGDAKKIRALTAERIAYRHAHHPMDYPSIGSIFKNVPLEKVAKAKHKHFAHVIKTDPFPVIPAAYLISETSLKGVSFGGAMISGKHPNFIVNALDASAKDVEHLIRLVKAEVKRKFKIDLEEEIMKI